MTIDYINVFTGSVSLFGSLLNFPMCVNIWMDFLKGDYHQRLIKTRNLLNIETILNQRVLNKVNTLEL